MIYSVEKKIQSKSTNNILKLGKSGPPHISTYVKIFIDKSKVGIYRERMWVYISASSKICPLKELKFYLALPKISENSEEFIFRSLTRGKNFRLCTRNNRFHIAESEKSYWSSKSSEYWLEKLRVTQLMIWWGFTCHIQRFVR